MLSTHAFQNRSVDIVSSSAHDPCLELQKREITSRKTEIAKQSSTYANPTKEASVLVPSVWY